MSHFWPCKYSLNFSIIAHFMPVAYTTAPRPLRMKGREKLAKAKMAVLASRAFSYWKLFSQLARASPAFPAESSAN